MPIISPIQHRCPASLKPYSGNPRSRSRTSIRRLAELIMIFGFRQPIVVDEEDEILIGHGRLDAALTLKLETVPVMVISGLSGAERKALRLSDNRIAEESKWNPDLLKIEIQDLIEVDYDLSLTAFDEIEIDPILETECSAEEDSDDWLPSISERPIAREDDVWRLGDHFIVCGNGLDAGTYAKVLRSRKAAMVFTDPPYNRKTCDIGGRGRIQHDNFAMASGEMSDGEFARFLADALNLTSDHSTDGSVHYICMDWRSIAELVAIGKSIYSKLLNIAVWAKPNGGQGSFYRSQHEMVAVFKQGDAPHVNNVQLGRLGRYRSNLWQYPGGSSFSKTRQEDLEDHPTVKPMRMVADAICDATRPGDLVLDPFGGVGTTLLAAQSVGRKAAMIEIEPKFVDVTLRRFQERTGVEPVLMPDEIALSKVRTERTLHSSQAEW